MPKGRVSKLIHSNNGLLGKTVKQQQTSHIILQYNKEITNYNEAFNSFMKIMCYPHKIKGNYIININGLNENEFRLLQSHIENQQ
jgi:hypothetical protein